MCEHGPFIRGDIGVGQPKLAVVHRGIAIGNIRLAHAQGLHFGAHQDDAHLKIVLDRVVIARAPVLGDNFVICLFGFLGHSFAEISEGARWYKVRQGEAGMFIQIAIGTGLLLVTIIIAGVTLWWLEVAFVRAQPWLARPPHRPKLIVVLCAVALWIILQMTVAVWLWAVTMRGLGLFETMEASVYFALVAFTTLGFGDVLLPLEWRLLSGMASINGLLNIGLVTALLVEALRQVRLHQAVAEKGET